MYGQERNGSKLLGGLPTGDALAMPNQDSDATEPIKLPELAVLVAHSDSVIATGLVELLRKNGHFRVFNAGEGQVISPSVSTLVQSVDVVIADYDEGIKLMVDAKQSNARVVILTHRDSQMKICHALSQGVRGYLLLGCGFQDVVAGIRSVYEGGVAITPRVASRLAESLKQQSLTAREQSVLRHMTLGWSNKRIARALGMALGTVKTHVKSILAKLDADTRGEAVAIARHRGLLADEVDSDARGGGGLPRLGAAY